ncbi:hypothetical protein [Allohahella marinimesophila]|uniref:Uncharacterized protein n=1 Tax=Allohahella marinimesophila TaxID=1054972 RepID=A0ABP7P2V7_9GAMM
MNANQDVTGAASDERRGHHPVSLEISEYALSVAISYLKSRRVDFNLELRQQVLGIVARSLEAASSAEMMALLIDELDSRFSHQLPPAAEPTPPLNRGSIGYD